MHPKQLIAMSLVGFAAIAASYELPEDHILWAEAGNDSSLALPRRQASSNTASAAAASTSLAADSSCSNGPYTRSCWSNGYSAATDFDQKWPTTGVTRYYTLTITNTTCNLDGHGPRICMLYNNQYPGPTIRANWGDNLQITVVNNLQNNGTSTHWHGLRQHGSNLQDGVNGITQCPLAPGQSQTYNFQATQFGTSWYHSHYSNQYGDGLVGPIVIDGPASTNYDVDNGPLPVSDWYYQTAFQVGLETTSALQRGGPGPIPDTILINGTNKNGANAGGAYATTLVTRGKKHRIRLINTSVDNAIRVSIDGHAMQIITSDFTAVQPLSVTSVLLAIGQRYDVVVTANQAAANYWIRAVPESACLSSAGASGLAVLHYAGVALADPTSSATAVTGVCAEPRPLTPWAVDDVGDVAAFQSQVSTYDVDVDATGVSTNGRNLVVWGINMTGIMVQWATPTLTYVMNKDTNYPVVSNLVSVPNEGTWVYWIIQETQPGRVNIPHPIHLHGHDFYVMGTGAGTFNVSSDPANLQYNNPPRRDTAILPAGGWLALAFATNNPGAWLMHCHIAWHISEGLGVQFLESMDTMAVPQPNSAYTSQCAAWNSYDSRATYKQNDSGL